MKNILADKNLSKKIGFIYLCFSCFFILNFIRCFSTTSLYYNDIANKFSLALATFASMLFDFAIGFFSTPFFILTDIWQLALGTFSLYKIIAIFCILLSLVPISLITGFFITYTHNKVIDENSQLPEFNFKSCLKIGMKYIGGLTVLSIPFIILIICLLKVVYAYCADLAQQNPDISWVVSMIRSYMIYSAIIIGTIPFYIYISFAIIPFIQDLSFKSLINFKKAFKVVFKNFKSFIKYFGILLLIDILTSAVIFAARFIISFIQEMNLIDFHFENLYSEDINMFIALTISIVIFIFILFFINIIISNIQAKFTRQCFKQENSNNQ